MKNFNFNFVALIFALALLAIAWILLYLVGMPTNKTMNGIVTGTLIISALCFVVSLTSIKAYLVNLLPSVLFTLAVIAGVIAGASTVVSLLWKVNFPTYYGLITATNAAQWHGFAMAWGFISLFAGIISWLNFYQTQSEHQKLYPDDSKIKATTTTVGGFATSKGS